MGVIAKYKFNQELYADFIPQFNTEFTNYTITDSIDTDGYTIRIIESDSLPTLMRFGQVYVDGESGATDKSLSLLEVYECDTSNITSMDGMFQNCSSLTSLNVSNFNTNQVTNMKHMFSSCSSLTSLDVSNFNTSKVTDTYAMFNGCFKLTSLNVSNFNTNQVTNMSYMFYNCKSLTSLDVSNFNTNNVTIMFAMFYSCSSLTSLDVSNFNTSKVTNMGSMFQYCSSLTSLDVSNFNTSKVVSMGNMFSNCSSLTSLNVSSFNTNQVVTMSGMFYNCSKLTSLDVSNFNTEKVTNMSDMFNNCSKITDIGTIYCNSDTISEISELIATDTTIWYSDAKLEDLIKKENITYKEYKMNILESDEEVELRRIGNVYDELNLETGELIQRISKIVLDGSENWEKHKAYSTDNMEVYWTYNNFIPTKAGATEIVCDKLITANPTTINSIRTNGAGAIFIGLPSNSNITSYLQSNPITVQYLLTTPIIKTINLKGKPSINWQGDTYLHLENNTLYPQLDCEIESINYYEIPKLKANTLYTLRYVGEPTQCIFGGLTYKAENNMILTSGSSDNFLYFDKEVRKVVLIEGDVRDRNFDYFEGIESLGAVEIITHKSDMPIFAKGGRK